MRVVGACVAVGIAVSSLTLHGCADSSKTLAEGNFTDVNSTNASAFSDFEPPVTAPLYALEKGACCCPKEDEVDSMDVCHQALHFIALRLGFDSEEAEDVLGWNGTDEHIPPGCSFKVWPSGKTGRGHWNRAEKGKARDNMIPICLNASAVQAHVDGASAPADKHTAEGNSTHANSTPAEGNSTDANSTPANSTPANSTDANSTDANSTDANSTDVVAPNHVAMVMPPVTAPLYELEMDKCCCPKEDEVQSIDTCQLALHFVAGVLGFDVEEAEDLGWNGTDENIPPGCSFKVWPSGKTGRGHWNRAEKGKARHNMIPICLNASAIQAHMDFASALGNKNTALGNKNTVDHIGSLFGAHIASAVQAHLDAASAPADKHTVDHIGRLFDASIRGAPTSRVPLALLVGSMFVAAVSLAVVFRRGVCLIQPSAEDATHLIAEDDEGA